MHIIAGAVFMLTIPDAEGIALVVIVEGNVRVLLLAVVIGTVAWLFIGGEVSDIMSLKVRRQNIRVYLFLLKKITMIVGYIFVARLKRSSRLGSS